MPYTALSMRTDDASRLFVIVFLTDGIPTVGVTDEEEILSNVSKNNKSYEFFALELARMCEYIFLIR